MSFYETSYSDSFTKDYTLSPELVDHILKFLPGGRHDLEHVLYSMFRIECPVYPACILPFYSEGSTHQAMTDCPGEHSPRSISCSWMSFKDEVIGRGYYHLINKPGIKWSVVYDGIGNITVTRVYKRSFRTKDEVSVMVLRQDSSMRVAGLGLDGSPVLQGNNYMKWDLIERSGTFNFVTGYIARSCEDLFREATAYTAKEHIIPPRLCFGYNILTFITDVVRTICFDSEDDNPSGHRCGIDNCVSTRDVFDLWSGITEEDRDGYPVRVCPFTEFVLCETEKIRRGGSVHPRLLYGSYGRKTLSDPKWDVEALNPVDYSSIYEGSPRVSRHASMMPPSSDAIDQSIWEDDYSDSLLSDEDEYTDEAETRVDYDQAETMEEFYVSHESATTS